MIDFDHTKNFFKNIYQIWKSRFYQIPHSVKKNGCFETVFYHSYNFYNEAVWERAVAAVWKWELLESDKVRFSETVLESKWQKEVLKSLW